MGSHKSLYGLPVSAKLQEIYRRLLKLHRTNVDDVISLTPLEMLVLAILSQRTTDPIAQQAFENLRRMFPDWSALCDAPISSIERAIHDTTWPDKKAKFLQRAFQHIRGWRRGALNLDHLFEMSDTDASAWLDRLPGVGIKTSACVLLFSTLRRAVLPVDTGHRRIMTRLGMLGPSISSDRAHPILQSLLPRDWTPREIEAFHNVIKKHAQTYCDAKQPRCAGCALRDLCRHAQTCFQPEHEEEKRHTAVKRRSSTQPNPLQMCMLYE
ncbi:hypothetical protein CCAX7_14110 [Capsulimonas corticalis]|uniref:HhH-GPD domain-containing protein n=1 Tax=Capsulimonas corticalis TaxID=2219043 RepID=A0A9N7Q9M0_9BACT|nr:Fe-S cluster assembly protein HesB [Capsulimonas corticalis]BDI29360.1 hypothetical protein CCAX7_14110 [Capsulimonas corticalis]